ncbi:peptidase inhibitor family I36 protein [Streptomyces sp. NPDC000594]|uniref:peptidase inhibitor family I36 protein n=1 Tax=Streptomyces sp. NPDC000594 TaxID=3154261 RepID=UPI0033264F22
MNRTMSRKIPAAVALLAAMGMGMVTAGSATAAENPAGAAPVSVEASKSGESGAAQTGRLHLYGGNNFSGYTVSFTATNHWLGDNYWDGTSISVDNGANSAKNRTGRWVQMYTIGSRDGNCRGDNVGFANGVDFTNLGGFNNTISCLIFS